MADFAIRINGEPIRVNLGNSTEISTRAANKAIAAQAGAEAARDDALAANYADLSTPDAFDFTIQDESGEAVAGVRTSDKAFVAKKGAFDAVETGSILLNGEPFITNPEDLLSGDFRYNLELLPIYGQSLSLGAKSTPNITTEQIYDSVMFQGGLSTTHPDNALSFYAALVPAVAATPADSSVYGEVPVLGAADMVKERISSVSGLSYTDQNFRLLLNAPGEGGLAIEDLDNPSTYYSQFTSAITAGYSRAQANNETFGCRAMLLVHGEQDNSDGTPVATVKTEIETLRSDLEAHIQATTGQADTLQIISNQTQRYFNTTGRGPFWQQAVLELQQDDPNFHVACPMYQFQYADTVHLTAESSRWMGAYLGLCYSRVVLFGEEWSPVRPLSSVRQGQILEVKFHVPAKPLVIDTVRVPSVANNGFTLFGADGVTPITINSVEVSNPDTVRIIAASTIPAGAVLKYAIDNGDGGTLSCGPTGPRGNLRDSQGDQIVFDPNGTANPLHNWCLMVPSFVIS
ncbi:hypothetical protein [Qipengyuania huizhouensis]|uniref:hypothetical protein n=1 Tax=Qipengyuania huizhouensis TaxID=2867245 RepID=UPI001C8726B6|nr:hypothetical protein [Qipengyuania huizhouensis]MBX7459565.1 hypothetical protein [Qipengyuania huizhouensis]